MTPTFCRLVGKSAAIATSCRARLSPGAMRSAASAPATRTPTCIQPHDGRCNGRKVRMSCPALHGPSYRCTACIARCRPSARCRQACIASPSGPPCPCGTSCSSALSAATVRVAVSAPVCPRCCLIWHTSEEVLLNAVCRQGFAAIPCGAVEPAELAVTASKSGRSCR